MSNKVEKVVKIIAGLLREEYPEDRHYEDRDIQRDLYKFYIYGNDGNRKILKITQCCIEDNNETSIIETIKNEGVKKLNHNQNKEVLLKKDLNFSINEITS